MAQQFPVVKIGTTKRALYPKADPLRPFPKSIENRLGHKGKKQRIVFASHKTSSQNIDLIKNKFTEVSVLVKKNAKANLVLLGQANANSYALGLINITIEAGAIFHVVEVVSGGARIETHIVMNIVGRGAMVQYSGMFHGQKKAHQALHIVLRHQAPDTQGDIFIKGVFEDESKGIISGLIKIDKAAHKTNSYFKDDVLLFDGAMAESVPTLEIEADDVKASHGSTTARVNEDQIFYLTSRGVNGQQARRMIISGFFESFLKKARVKLPKKIKYFA